MSQAAWGQLAYASTRGGFGVHAEQDLQPAERDQLIGGAFPDRTSFGQEVPIVASAEQAQGFYRNLSYRFDPDIGGCYWHSFPAGPDESGRTGNCFVHALLHREDREMSTAWRPIEVWRSPSLLTPFGARQVQAATLPQLPPEQSAAVTRAEVVRFLVDFSVDRFSPLRSLLHALAEPRAAPVILAVPNPDDGALWVAAVSYLMSPTRAREFSFSVWEAPQLLTPSRLPAVELLCLDEREVSQRVLELGLPVIRAEGPQPHLDEEDNGLGTAWSQLAVEQLLDLPQAEIVDLLEQIDGVSSLVAPDPAHRTWPLAMVLGRRLEAARPRRDETSDSVRPDPVAERTAQLRAEQRALAARVLVRTTPRTIGQDQGVWNTSLALVEERYAKETLTELHDALTRAAPGPLRTMLQETYVKSAAQDLGWVSKEQYRERPDWEMVPGEWGQPWVKDAFAQIDTDDAVQTAVGRTLLTDFLLSQGWPKPPDSWFPVSEARTTRDESFRRPDPDAVEEHEVAAAPEPAGEHGSPFSVIWEVLQDRDLSQEYAAQLGTLQADTVEYLLWTPVIRLLNSQPRGLGLMMSDLLLERVLPLELVRSEPHPQLTDGRGALWAEALYYYGRGGEAQTIMGSLTHVLLHGGTDLPREAVEPLLQLLARKPESLAPEVVTELVDRHKDLVPFDVVKSAFARVSSAEMGDLANVLREVHQDDRSRWGIIGGGGQLSYEAIHELAGFVDATEYLRPEMVDRLSGIVIDLSVETSPDGSSKCLGSGWETPVQILIALAVEGSRRPEDLRRLTFVGEDDQPAGGSRITQQAGRRILELTEQYEHADRLVYNSWLESWRLSQGRGGRLLGLKRQQVEEPNLESLVEKMFSKTRDLGGYEDAFLESLRDYHQGLTDQEWEQAVSWFDKMVKLAKRRGPRASKGRRAKL